MNKKNNPFNISFGEEPNSIIDRPIEFENIISSFDSEFTDTKIKIITGIRGCGKTVLLTRVKDYFNNKSNWITVDLTQYSNMLEQLAGKLYEDGKLKRLFLKTEFNFSFKGVGLTIQGDNPIGNIESLLDRIFIHLNKKKVKVLVLIDDVSNNDYLKQFIQSYQVFIRSRYNVFLLMSGLYENISDLQNNDNLTFLLRAPKVKLFNLNLRAIAIAYKKYLKLDDGEAIELAKTTKGYAYAFQLIGNTLYKNNSRKLSEDEMGYIDTELETNVYSKIWESLSFTDKKMAFTLLETNKTSEIIKSMGINNAKFQVYRKRLIDNGIVDDSTRGVLYFCLPRFKEFVQFQKALLD